MKHRRPSCDTLYYLYVKKDYLRSDLAKIFRVSDSTVDRWLQYYGIYKYRETSLWIKIYIWVKNLFSWDTYC